MEDIAASHSGDGQSASIAADVSNGTDSRPRAAETRQRMQAELAAIWEQFKGLNLERVGMLEEATMALLEGALEAEAQRQAEREAHKLAGVVGSFGFAEGSRLAREIEELFGAGTAQRQALRLSELVVALRRELEGVPAHSGASTAEELPRPDAVGPVLLLVGGVADLAERLAMEAGARGIRLESAADGAAALAAIDRERPAVMLLDLAATGGTEDDPALLGQMVNQIFPAPVLVLTERSALDERVDLARSGAYGFLSKPMAPSQVMEAVVQALPPIETSPGTVLALDDDPQALATRRAVLEPHKYRLITVDDPQRFWTALEETSPDLVMLDVDMPKINGIDLCRVVRNDLRWSGIPVLFLTAHADPDVVRQVFAAGGDDYIQKPIIGPELVARITNRLERVRLLQRAADTDPLTGVANRRRSEHALEQFRRLADRHKQSLSLAVVDLDRFKQINDQFSHAAGDRVLRRAGQLLLRSFRGEDVVARWGGDEFVIGMYGAGRDDGVQRLAEVLEALRGEEFTEPNGVTFRVTFSAGVAEYPADGATLQTLYRSADGARRQAKAAGRDRVLPVGWEFEKEQSTQKIDVAVVDDDPALAGLLLHGLKTRGYRTAWLQDGGEAVAALAGPRPRIRARVVLLDVDLPGIDGLGILRRLADDAIVRDTRVIMLTARASEAETVQALQLGAFDHVAKPFSVPVLMQRIRRALQP